MLKKILSGVLLVSGLFSGFASAQQGELIVSQSYIKAGCTGWEFREGGGVGTTGEPQYPKTYRVDIVSCNGGHVVRKVQLFYGNGSLYSCNVALLDTDAYTLSSTSCTSFEVRTKVTPLPLEVPAAPTYAHIGNVNGCGTFPPGACPAPQYWVVWPAMPDASSYEYSFVGTLPFAGSTTGTSITIPYGYNPTSGKVRACNANNQCSAWTIVTASW
ncbi:MAG: hypothetical protein B0W54_15935 [Cellvibrio sp. 79]|nr:MAG: hypothetical protein B0W54_15935 [Cellvibrio sp. 79]